MGIEVAVNYIRNSLASGVSKDKLVKALQDKGWSNQQILEALRQLNAESGSEQETQDNEFGGEFLKAKDLLKLSFKRYKERFWALVGILAIPFLFQSILSLVITVMARNASAWTTLPFVLIFIVSLIFGPWSMLAIVTGIGSDEKIGVFEAYGKSKAKFFPFYGLSISSGLISIALMFLLVFPAIFFGFYTMFWMFILADEDIRGLDNLLTSREYVKGRIGKIFTRLFVFGLLSFLIYLPGIVLSTVGQMMGFGYAELLINILYFPLTPLSLVYSYYVYRNARELAIDEGLELNEKVKKGWIISRIVGGLIIIALFGLGIFATVRNPQIFSELGKVKETELDGIEMELMENQANPGDLLDEVPVGNSPNGVPRKIPPSLESVVTPTPVASSKPTPTPTPTPTPAPSSPFESTGAQSIGNDVTLTVSKVTKSGNTFTATATYKNSSSSTQLVQPIQLIMSSAMYGTGATPAYIDMSIAAGQAKTLTLNYEALPDDPPYTFKSLTLDQSSSVTLGTYK